MFITYALRITFYGLRFTQLYMKELSKIERMNAIFAGEEVDRPPFSLWYHFGLQHAPGELHAQAQLDFYRAYNLDWLKVMSDYSYPFPSGVSDFRSKDDLLKLDRFDIEKSPYNEQLKAIGIISTELKGETIFLDTVFNPWNIIHRAMLKEKMSQYMREEPEALHYALEVVTDNMIAYCRKIIERGANGVFISVPASSEYVSHGEYTTFMKPYDLKLFRTVREFAPIIIAHIHGDDLHFEDVLAYPADGINWADRAAGPGLAEARTMYDGVLMGGIDHIQFSYTQLSALRKQTQDAIRVGGTRKFILAAGCSVQTYAFPEIIRGVCQAAGIK